MIIYQLNFYICSHCGAIHDTAIDCRRHEAEEHARSTCETKTKTIVFANQNGHPNRISDGVSSDRTTSANTVSVGRPVVKQQDTKFELLAKVTVADARKQIPCAFCGKKFRTRGTKVQHERIHTGHKPYKCHICPKAYTQKSNLEYHIRQSHTGETPYGCDLCDQKFRQKANLDVHRRKHTGERPYSCVACRRGFIDMPGRNGHQKICKKEQKY